MKTEASSRKKPMNIGWIIKTPIRAISKALDLYVKGVTNFSNTYNRPLRTMVEVTPTSQQLLPRSLTTSRLPDHDEPPEGALVRSISAGGTTGCRTSNMKISNLELYMIQQRSQELQSSVRVSRKGVPRSCVVGMGKIDEDRVSSFRDDNIILESKLGVKDEDSLFSKRLS